MKTIDLQFNELAESEMVLRASAFENECRPGEPSGIFRTDQWPQGIIEKCLLTAGSAPSGRESAALAFCG